MKMVLLVDNRKWSIFQSFAIILLLQTFSPLFASGEKKTETVQWQIGIPEPPKYDNYAMGSYAGGHNHYDWGHSLPSGGYGGTDMGCWGGHGIIGIVLAVIGAFILIPFIGSLIALKLQLLSPLFGGGIGQNPIVTANVGQKGFHGRLNDLLPMVDEALDKLARSFDRPAPRKPPTPNPTTSPPSKIQ